MEEGQTTYQNSCKKWIADVVGEDYKRWSVKQPNVSTSRVFIESPTGTGKTSFILDVLLPDAAEKGRNILYLGNRTALEEQTKYALERRLMKISEENSPEAKADISQVRFFQYPNSMSIITILNYQSVIGYIRWLDSTDPYNTKPFYYVIFDEAHFFLEDALFNPKTLEILRRIIKRFNNSVFLFMSATLEESIVPLMEVLYSLRPCHPQQFLFDDLYYSKSHFFYTNSYQSAKYNPMFFREYDELIERIKECSRLEKWLIFVSSKQEGKSLVKTIKEQTKRKVMLLTADKKTGKAWERLVNESCFMEDILIVTKVLDNGANIIDSAVKHIVLPFCYRIDYLQMLGRRRSEDGETLNIYSRCPTKPALNSQLRRIKQMKNAMMPFLSPDGSEKKISSDKMTQLLQKYWMRGNQAVNNLFYIDMKRNLVLNPLARYKVELLNEYYSELAKSDDPSLIYPYIVYDWLKFDSSIRPDFLSVDRFDSLSELLSDYLDSPIPKEEQEKFYKSFQHYYKLACIKQFGQNTKELNRALSIRKGKTQRKRTMNESLAMLALPYQVVKRNNCWILERREPETAP